LPYLASTEDLITHGLHALRETLQQDKELTIHNTSIGIVGSPAPSEKGVNAKGSFRIIEGELVAPFLSKLPPKAQADTQAEEDTDDEPAAGGEDVVMGET
jgi:20S proteasome subunit alpha 6